MFTYTLENVEVKRLLKKIEGEGGMQTLLRSLRKSLKANVLTVSEKDFDKICRYLGNKTFGVQGGWQERVPKALREDATLELATRPAKKESA